MHALGDFGKPALHASHLIDHLGESLSNIADVADAAAHLLAESVHLHDAAGYGGLHLSNHVLNVQRSGGRLIGQSANFARDHQESAPTLASFFRLNGGIDAQQVGLIGHLGNRVNDRIDAGGLLADSGQALRHIGGRCSQSVHGASHGLHPGATGRGILCGFTCGLRQFFHLAKELGARRSDLSNRGGNFYAA